MTNATAPLNVCAACRAPFVVPVALLEIVDEGLYSMVLECKNCDHTVVGVYEDADVEVLDRELDRAHTRIEAALEICELTRQMEEADTFAAALHDDLILPEDF